MAATSPSKVMERAAADMPAKIPQSSKVNVSSRARSVVWATGAVTSAASAGVPATNPSKVMVRAAADMPEKIPQSSKVKASSTARVVTWATGAVTRADSAGVPPAMEPSSSLMLSYSVSRAMVSIWSRRFRYWLLSTSRSGLPM